MNAWLTPDLDIFSAPHVERTISLPGELWYLIGGCLDLLADAANWEYFGAATPDETAEFFAAVVEEWSMSSFRNVGMIACFATGAVPSGWRLLDGSTIAQADYPELVSKVPAIWLSGSNIVLPDCRARFVVGAGPTHANGIVGGANTHTLTIGEMPSHSHTANITPQSLPAFTVGAGPAIVTLTNGSTNTAGTGSAHNNMPAYFAARWAIYAGR